MTSRLFFCLLATLASANGPPLPQLGVVNGQRVPNVAFEDSEGRARHLYELGGLPVILLPIYTRCGSACPRNSQALRQALFQLEEGPRSLQVFLFSLDENDTPAGLREFRSHLRLPASWTLARLSGAQEIHALADSIDLRFAKAGSEWQHPNVAAVLSPELRVSAFLYGSDYPPSELARALAVARGSSSWAYRIAPYLLTLSVLGITFSTVSLVCLLDKRRTRLQGNA